MYLLQSQADPDRFYVGLAKTVGDRLRRHNGGQVLDSAKFVPWQIETAAAFCSKTKAVAFEKYLKTLCDRAFAKKHF